MIVSRIARRTLPSFTTRSSTTFLKGLSRNSLIEEIGAPHPNKNVSANVLDKVGRNLHLQKDHPLCLTKLMIEEYCTKYAHTLGQSPFQLYDDLSPIVTTEACFDELRVPPDHVGRRPSDTYYITDKKLLRTHTSAHQCQILRSGSKSFLCAGDVYRRDEIDSTHYPVFHQMEGVRVFETSSAVSGVSGPEENELLLRKSAESDLKRLLEGLARHLFGSEVEIRWREDYFPFTEPSFEMDVFYRGDWMELLGCGLVHRDVMRHAGLDRDRDDNGNCGKDVDRDRSVRVAWAFGLGLERLAMVLFSIPDIRLFWTEDRRFLDQFSGDKLTKGSPIVFRPYSKYPDCYKDVSFWIPTPPPPSPSQSSSSSSTGREFHSNDVYEIIRGVAGDVVERVQLFDTFVHPKTNRTSHAYRVTYRHMDRSLTNEEVDELQLQVREALQTQLHVQLSQATPVILSVCLPATAGLTAGSWSLSRV
eukprot:gene9560-19861_t